MNCTYLPYSQTGFFSKLVIDYLSGSDALKPFYTFSPSMQGVKLAIEQRKSSPVDRQLLVDTLNSQYAGLAVSPALRQNMDVLLDDNTFTICTAHQPNLLTGYLYFIYKIMHTIRLAADLKTEFPAYNFVPVYYMGSEDNDLDELGTFRYGGKKFVWDAAGQTGAVGRMKTASLKPLLDDLFRLLGPPGDNCETLKQVITDAYLQRDNIADATQYLVNELLGRFGLVVLNPDNSKLKQAFTSVMSDDLFNHTADAIVTAQIEKLEQHYKSQAHPRQVNLFYLKDNLRERIERKGDIWHVVNTDIEFDRQALERELKAHPDRFSPNVILRGLFQETILPDVAFIGGGAEVAYWLQLQSLFQHYNVFYPVVLLRQSVLWIDERMSKAVSQVQLSPAGIFDDENMLLRKYVTDNSDTDWQTKEELKEIEHLLGSLRKKAAKVDATLNASAEAVLTKIRYQLQMLEKKMLKAEKRKMQEALNRVIKIKTALFPNNSLQERVENFTNYFLEYNTQYFDVLYSAIQPLRNEFLIIEDNGKDKA